MSAVIGYVRVSSHIQIENTSLDSQEALIRAKYPQVECVFRDEGVSGSVPLFDRPSGRFLRQKLVPGSILVVTKVDRAFRSIDDFSQSCKTLKNNGVDLAVLDLMGGAPLTSDKFAVFVVTLITAFAELERKMITERTLEGRRQKIRQGSYVGGKAPFGHVVTTDGVLDELDWYRGAVQTIDEMAKKNLSLREIALEVSRKFKIKCSHPTVKRMLDNGEIRAIMEEIRAGVIGGSRELSK